MSYADEIKKALKTEKVAVGTNEVLKNLKMAKAKKVYLTSNVKADVKEAVLKYAAMANTEVVQLKYANDELGTICKKPFGISVLALIK
jgi:large subunit ribosomal protein L30e